MFTNADEQQSYYQEIYPMSPALSYMYGAPYTIQANQTQFDQIHSPYMMASYTPQYGYPYQQISPPPTEETLNQSSLLEISQNDSGYNSTICTVSPSHSPPPEPEPVDKRIEVDDDTTGTKLANDEVVANVHGRLCLTAAMKTYIVTAGEIRRRLEKPEQLTSSSIGPYLRRSKTAQSGKDLRDELLKLGIKVPMGRRAIERRNTFSCLVEGEALTISNDFDSILKRVFHENNVASIMASHLIAGLHPETRLRDLQGAKAFLEDTERLFFDTGPKRGLEINRSKAEQDMKFLQKNFNLKTHGLGMAFMATWIRIMKTHIDTAIYCLNMGMVHVNHAM